MNVAEKLIEAHLVAGEMVPGEEISLTIDHGLCQDTLGLPTALVLEALDIDRIQMEVACQYVDHNLLQADNRAAEDHHFLKTICQRFGMHYSPAGNGISHPVHMERLGRPGATLIGGDSHSCSAGSMGMLGMGTGSIEVGMALAGMPISIVMPKIWGIELTGELPDWVSAKDVILEMLRRHGVKGGVGRIIEYYGPGLDTLSAMDRHVIANMGAELGATTSVFPADKEVKNYLESVGRGDVFTEIIADEGATYDLHDAIDMSALEPLIAKPSSPGNVVPVRECAGEKISQGYIGSSANPGYRDFAVAAMMVEGQTKSDEVSYDVNPTSREMLTNLLDQGLLAHLIVFGARMHQAGCNGCMGMGQAAASGANSLRTTPRNFPGRSGVKGDQVWLCSPETVTAGAIKGEITDPRELGIEYPKVKQPDNWISLPDALVKPIPIEEAKRIKIVKGDHTAPLPEVDPFPERIELPVLIKLGDNIDTDALAPAGAQVLPFRSNIQKTAEFTLMRDDPTLAERAFAVKEAGGHLWVGGDNFGQGSSRVHAVLAPQYLGLKIVIAKSFARIFWQNMINGALLPVTFDEPSDYDKINQGDVLILENAREAIAGGTKLTLSVKDKDLQIPVSHALSPRQTEIILEGGIINWGRAKLPGGKGSKAA
ncbi:MAG: aconitate hydratase [Rhodospirillaceae bacterium]|nr:aconitate hydratase [Rhodospirillaceae bacterium]MBL24613.1 aconitate hydratase [Rhodospirillaceae bacterium]